MSYILALPPLHCNATTEHVNYCGNACERTCSNVLQRIVPCPRICGPPACECNRGYARYNGVCVGKRECPISSKCDIGILLKSPFKLITISFLGFTCPENEHVDGCGNYCEMTCEKANQTNIICPLVCGPPACVCDNGFARHGDFCIPKPQCFQN